MKIDLDELEECSKCGTVFNYRIATILIKHETDFQRSEIREGRCPSCEEIFTVYG